MLLLTDVFNEDYYLEINEVAAEAVASGEFNDGLEHFKTIGIDNGLRFTPFVDLSYYQTVANPDLIDLTTREVLDHLLELGIEGGRIFSPFVDLEFYKEANPELSDLSNTEAFRHLQDIGIDEGLQFASHVDLEAFRSFSPLPESSSNFDTFAELATFFAPEDEGHIQIPLGLGLTIPDELELHEPIMEAGGGDATITYSKADNTVQMDFEFEGVPFRQDFVRPEDVSTPFNRFPVSVENSEWQMWIIGHLFSTESTFWYDGETNELIGNEFDIFDEIPADDTPIDVNNDGGLDIPVTLPVVQMIQSPIFEGNPDGTASLSLSLDYDQLLDSRGTAGAYVAMAPYDLDQEDAFGIYYTEGGLPLSQAMTWDDFLANIRPGGQGISLIMSSEPNPKPGFLASRSNTMEAFSNIYPQLTPDDVVLEFATGVYRFKEPADRVTHVNDPWPARAAILAAETEPIFDGLEDTVMDAVNRSDVFDGNHDIVFAGAG
ncbi:MAG: hypothetical protein ACFBSF_13505, partial [Leptolyngbyaceae cyanobacterium]